MHFIMKINIRFKVISFFVLIATMFSCSQSYPKKVTIKGIQGQVLTTYSLDEKGRKQGLELSYFDNGISLKSEIHFLDGKKQGLSKNYYKNGIVAKEAKYENGLIVEKAHYYNENGTLRKEESYSHDGKLIRFKTYYESGRSKEFAAFRVKDNTLNAWKFLNEMGELVPRKSNFIQVKRIKGRTFEATIIHPGFTHFDSVVVYSTEDISAKNYKEIVKKRKMKFNNSPVIITTVEDDFYNNEIYYLILAYPNTKDKLPVILDYRLFWSRSEPIPVDNVRPIF